MPTVPIGWLVLVMFSLYSFIFVVSVIRTLCVGAISVWRHHTSYVDVPTQVTAMMCQ